MRYRFGPLVFIVGCLILCGAANADTKVGDFEGLDHDQRVAKLTELTRTTLDKIEAKNPVLALSIQEYFIVPPPGEKNGRGATALIKQIDEYNRVDPQGYTIENAFAKVLSEYLVSRAAKQPTTGPTTQPDVKRPS